MLNYTFVILSLKSVYVSIITNSTFLTKGVVFLSKVKISNFLVYVVWDGGGPRVVVSTAASHTRVRGSFPGLGGLEETKMFHPHPPVNLGIVRSLRNREVACSASDRQGSGIKSFVWKARLSHLYLHTHNFLLAQFSLYMYVQKSGLKPDSFNIRSLGLGVAGKFPLSGQSWARMKWSAEGQVCRLVSEKWTTPAEVRH